LQNDPNELDNLIEQSARREIVQELCQRLDRWRERTAPPPNQQKR